MTNLTDETFMSRQRLEEQLGQKHAVTSWPLDEIFSERVLRLVRRAQTLGPLLAKEAAAIMARADEELLDIKTKIDRTFVTQFDIAIETKMYELIFSDDILKETYLHGEEDVESPYKAISEQHREQQAEFVWVIDSIEATSDFIRTKTKAVDAQGNPTGEGVYAFQAAFLYKGFPVYAVTFAPELEQKGLLQETSILFGTKVNNAAYQISLPLPEELDEAKIIIVKYKERDENETRQIVDRATNIFGTKILDKNASETAAAWDLLSRKRRNLAMLVNPRAFIYDSAAPGFHIFMNNGDVRRFDGSPLFPYRTEELFKITNAPSTEKTFLNSEQGNIPYTQVGPGFAAFADIILFGNALPKEAIEHWNENVKKHTVEEKTSQKALNIL